MTRAPKRLLRASGLVALGALMGSGALWAGSLAPQAEIRACINATDGHLYLAARCPADSLVWNQEGPAGPQGPPGPVGATGLQGLQGPAGPPGSTAATAKSALGIAKSGVKIVKKTTPGVTQGHFQVYRIPCPTGYEAVGGGYGTFSLFVPSPFIVNFNSPVHPTVKTSAWQVAVARTPGFKSLTLSVTAVCAKVG